jgi:hypothetical protein
VGRKVVTTALPTTLADETPATYEVVPSSQ